MIQLLEIFLLKSCDLLQRILLTELHRHMIDLDASHFPIIIIEEIQLTNQFSIEISYKIKVQVADSGTPPMQLETISKIQV